MEKVTQTQDWTQVAEIELVYKTNVKSSERHIIKDKQDAYNLLLSNWNKDTIELQEQFKVILLNRAAKVIGLIHHSTGSGTGTLIDIRMIIAAAIKSCASSIIMAHNHPSGSLKPSYADEKLTLRLREAAALFDITLNDHIIVTKDGFYSFANEGVL